MDATDRMPEPHHLLLRYVSGVLLSEVAHRAVRRWDPHAVEGMRLSRRLALAAAMWAVWFVASRDVPAGVRG